MTMINVITLREPWASLIGEGIKSIETRSWRTNYRGELYIHAGLTKAPKNDERITNLSKDLKGPLHYGTIFAKCNLVDCILIDEAFADKIKTENPKCYYCGDYTPGRFAWILSDIEYIEPIKAIGHLSIWKYNN